MRHRTATPLHRPPAARLAWAACSALASAAARGSAIAVQACSYGLPAQQEWVGRSLRVQVTPAGRFGPNDARQFNPGFWQLDAASARGVIAQFQALGVPPVIDYEHQTLNTKENGQPAPAAGWMRSLDWVDGQGLFAQVELTERAAQHVAAGEYRFFSPVFVFDTDDGTVREVRMGALTNTPAISGMQPLQLVAAASARFLLTTPTHSSTTLQESVVNPLLKALLAALGLPETTTEPVALAALSALGPLQPLQARAQVATAACTALALPADATADAVTAACATLRTAQAAASAQASLATPDPAKFVPIEAVQALHTQMAALSARQLELDVDGLVKPALADGRLLPAMESWARDLGRKDLAALSAHLKAAQPLAALQGSQTGGKPPAAGPGTATGHTLTPAELAVCSAMGLTPDAYQKARAATAAAVAA